MNTDLTGKRALVCGSTQGIGKASAIELASMGASITLVARDEEKLKEVIRLLPVDDTETHNYLVADFNNPDQLRQELDHFLKEHPVDILVNNTGGPKGGQAIDADVQEYIQAFSNHVVCNQILATAVVPGMKSAGWGRIINIISASVKTPLRGLGVSNTIRGAVASWAKTLSLELGPFGITVNNVLPSTSMTARLESLIQSRAENEGKSTEEVEEDMIKEIPVGRIGTAEDVAVAVAFLASPAAGYINGINLPVDGGKTPSL
ncbi:3-oxoacyl-[acyl-carrier protein] reductase [Arcticibacter tournemirensis]|uniref:SDR family oxidoreductase n=1 Tax=Arcticibacter tournemirensis TaxID=699437 RepID=A0A4Q0ME77_9SPHI|nr:SDR family oxidoreductase [Arcticibacter tournemirensis]KAA8485457.1 SDR family oxidoreductase [Arcticibacter tournemirensis]RXF71728.1 SDR family oxidoreductase [Arcticibacter tournemirensis]TQM48841.1 3-oxoacyl-[acyl-carrier protein] reductase [Arcticibacter tournemirensis]